MCGKRHTFPKPMAYPMQANVNSIGVPQLPRDCCDAATADVDMSAEDIAAAVAAAVGLPGAKWRPPPDGRTQ